MLVQDGGNAHGEYQRIAAAEDGRAESFKARSVTSSQQYDCRQDLICSKRAVEAAAYSMNVVARS